MSRPSGPTVPPPAAGSKGRRPSPGPGAWGRPGPAERSPAGPISPWPRPWSLGLLGLGVRTYFCVLGHGTTALADVLRTYEDHGLVRTLAVRDEAEAAHAAAALRWVTGEKAAVVTSIGPGALQAVAASLAGGQRRHRRVSAHLRGRDDRGRRPQHATNPPPRAGPVPAPVLGHGRGLLPAHPCRPADRSSPREATSSTTRTGLGHFSCCCR